jgi:hypothetical protein
VGAGRFEFQPFHLPRKHQRRYGNYSVKLNKKTSLQAGLRVEHTRAEGVSRRWARQQKGVPGVRKPVPDAVPVAAARHQPRAQPVVQPPHRPAQLPGPQPFPVLPRPLYLPAGQPVPATAVHQLLPAHARLQRRLLDLGGLQPHPGRDRARSARAGAAATKPS